MTTQFTADQEAQINEFMKLSAEELCERIHKTGFSSKDIKVISEYLDKASEMNSDLKSFLQIKATQQKFNEWVANSIEERALLCEAGCRLLQNACRELLPELAK